MRTGIDTIHHDVLPLAPTCPDTGLPAGDPLADHLRRPATDENRGIAGDERRRARAAALLGRYASDSLDPFSLRRDKSFHFAAGGFLAYRVVGRTAVVGGDPVGPPGRAGEILRSFGDEAAERHWSVVLDGASPSALDAYREAGYRCLRVGDEAVVDPRRFSLEGRAIRKVRQSVTRVRRLGWSVEVVDATALGSAARRAIDDLESAWRERQPRMQGFAMTLGHLWGPIEDRGAVFALARDADGVLRAFQRYAPYRGGLSLDVMRRDEDTANGLNEALVVAVVARAAELGLREVSLNFAGFSHIMRPDPETLSRGERVLRRLLGLVHGRFQLERLAAFNAKFFPAWRPRYLVYPSVASLPRAGLRVLQAEGYLPRRERDREPARPRLAPDLPAPAAAGGLPPAPPASVAA